MFSSHLLRFGAIFLLSGLVACNPFRKDNAVELDAASTTLNYQWNATLASPESLAGITQMNGYASMAPSRNGASTVVTVDLANASPGGLHPWAVRRGECGAPSSSEAFGTADAYAPLKVGSDGRSHASVSLPIRTPTNGQYFVVLHASDANARTVVACGNLSAPTR
ncbi:MAG: hypothetical protein RQ745_11580 [Longimicrobiales bacterium]|nr:hypothetical protein [Longimicrobiales bacterium]